MITTDEGLNAYLDEIRQAPIVAYDTEFIGEETYHPYICLVQLATSDSIALIDPLAVSSLDPVWELLADPEVKKVVHAGKVDLKPLITDTYRCEDSIVAFERAAEGRPPTGRKSHA